MKAFILNSRRIFYFIGDLRGQNKADIDAMLEKHEEFFNGNPKIKIST
jgi:ABC-2 type transport system ATP-binding protein